MRWFPRQPWACVKRPLTCASSTGGRAHDANASLVSGWTRKSVCFHVRTALAKSTRRMRSFFVHAGCFTWRLSMMSCCRKSAFSATSSGLLLARSASVPRGKEEVSGVVQWTKRVRSTLTDVQTSRLRQKWNRFKSALLLQKYMLIFMLSCEHQFTSSNFILVAHPAATSESILYPT